MTGGELPVTLKDARASIELLSAMYHSARTGEQVTLPLAAGHPVDVEVNSLAADSLGARNTGARVYGVARRAVERVVLVPDRVLSIDPVVSSTMVTSLLPTPMDAVQVTARFIVLIPNIRIKAVSSRVLAAAFIVLPLSGEVGVKTVLDVNCVASS